MKKNKLFKTVGVISALVGVFFLGAFTSLSYENMLDKFSPMFEILTYIDRNYYDIEKVDYDNILDEVLKGTMRGLEDPFAWYFDPVETKENEIDTSSKYGGIGSVVQYNIEFECLQVVSPMAGSPSERIGLRSGDLIITIDGTPVSQTGYYESVNMLRGEPGTKVILEVYRQGSTETIFFEITREIIEIKSVKSEIIDYEGSSISYIQITGF
ncbi:MAG TPA: PDZ domain-containing protein, partial [Mesotoga infera]|nr:PDZ domain-containing protein [Mesotoga infera]